MDPEQQLISKNVSKYLRDVNLLKYVHDIEKFIKTLNKRLQHDRTYDIIKYNHRDDIYKTILTKTRDIVERIETYETGKYPAYNLVNQHGIAKYDYEKVPMNLRDNIFDCIVIILNELYAHYYDKHGNVNGLGKLNNTKGYEHIWLDDLFYLDFYAIERFGKTRLGTLLHYAKQGQNRFLMKIMMLEIESRIVGFINKHKVDAIGFIPPTIRREVQLMKFMQTYLHIPLPVIELKKLSGIIPVPQKSLSKLEERIRNAENTFLVTEQRSFNHIVLIDDAVGSGSTLNQVAGKIKKKGIARKITGLALVGSLKSFDVIASL